MANSRANIYPVQLQGAELNLNKLDAEIKQYSGFNKNNAPFVGGCLSNIFTKDETIEGATSKNTYIAPNGDVYRVDTQGLWKNGEKLIDTTDKNFYDVEDLGLFFPNSTVYVYDEETYIYTIGKDLYYHSGKVEISLTESITGIIGKYEYYVTKQHLFNAEYEFVLVRYGTTTTGKMTYHFHIIKKDNEGELDYNHSEEIQSSLGYGQYRQQFVPFIHFSEENNNTVKLAIFLHVTGTKFAKLYSFNGTTVTYIQDLDVRYRNYSEPVGNISTRLCFSFNSVAFLSSSQIETLIKKDVVKCNYSVDFSVETPGIVLDADDPNHTAGIQYAYIVNSAAYFYKSWGTLGAATVKKDSGYKAFSVDDIASTFAKLYIAEGSTVGISMFIAGGLVNDCVLTNNMVASGISLPGGWILASEWNTVDVNFIFFGENTQDFKDNKYACLWKDINNGHWYKLKKSIPSLKVLNNQVIINSNTIFNSYDTSRNKVLLFAPAWNNRRFNHIENLYHEYDGTNMYFASSINEYALEDNASLIINPIEVFFYTQGSIELLPSNNNYIFINIYIGSTSEILYRNSYALSSSGEDIYTKNPVNLYTNEFNNEVGLPFPTNTDGNIQYSPSLFATQRGQYGNLVFISEGGTAYKLMTYDKKAVMSYFLSTAVEGLQDFFTIQGQLYGILDNQIYNFSIVNEIANRGDFIVSVEGLQFVGNTPYEALFFSKTNRCLYSFTGANVLNAKQFVDKISEVRNYKYNPATQSIFLITDIGVIVYSLFGIYQIEFLNCQDMYLLNNGVILTDNEGTFKYVKYYKEETIDDYTKENINLETCFYGMNNQTVTINDCLYMRIFSEEHEEGNLEVSATTLSLSGRMTEKTTFRIKESDWDKLTHTIYLRYQPKEQRGLGISFSINSPFKIASLSIGSQADAILIDKVSKGAINAPQRTSNNIEW